MKVINKLLIVLLICLISITMVGCSKVKETAESVGHFASEVGNEIADAASNVGNNVSEFALEAGENIKNYVYSIDTEKFKQGWDIVSDYISTSYASVISSEYVQNVLSHINTLADKINNGYRNNSTTQSRAGYIAEQWEAETFNINAAINDSDYIATAPAVTDIASPDVEIRVKDYDIIVEQAQSKYYADGKSSAQAQAQSWVSKRNDYSSTEESYKNFYNKNGLTNDAKTLLSSIYKGQSRIIPADQIETARAYLENEINSEQLLAKTNGLERQEALIETLSKLKTKLEAPDGTKSIELTYDEAQELSELAVEGKFDPTKYGITLDKLITPKAIVKQAISTGEKAALIKAAITVAPEILSIVYDAYKGENITLSQIKEIGIDGLFAGGEGFVEGGVSAALTVACKAGKFGEAFTNVNPGVISALTVLTVDAIKYGYSFANGEITANDYGNLIAQEIVLMAGSGIAIAILAPASPIAYLIGSMVGSTIAAVGFEFTKDMIYEIQDGGGFAAILPSGVTNTVVSFKDTIKNLNLKEKISGAKAFVVSTIEDGKIKLKSA